MSLHLIGFGGGGGLGLGPRSWPGGGLVPPLCPGFSPVSPGGPS
jgi:hypothetical protein